MSVIQSGDLYLGNAYVSIWALTTYNTTTGQYVPLTGASCTVEFTASPSYALAPVAMTETAIAGTYAATIAAATIDAEFANGPNYVNEIVKVGTTAVFQRPLAVHPVRYVP
jgi:hypothetical protein